MKQKVLIRDIGNIKMEILENLCRERESKKEEMWDAGDASKRNNNLGFDISELCE